MGIDPVTRFYSDDDMCGRMNQYEIVWTLHTLKGLLIMYTTSCQMAGILIPVKGEWRVFL
jgi:hypothetical protein